MSPDCNLWRFPDWNLVRPHIEITYKHMLNIDTLFLPMEFICFKMICAISLQAAAWAPSPNNLPIVPRNIKFTHLREYTASTCEPAAFGFVTRSKTCAINAPIFRSSQVPPNIWTNTTYACNNNNNDYQMFARLYCILWKNIDTNFSSTRKIQIINVCNSGLLSQKIIIQIFFSRT